MKKKLIASLLAASMLLTLSACGGKDSGTPDSKPASAAPTEQATDSGPATDAPDEAAPGNAAPVNGIQLYDGSYLDLDGEYASGVPCRRMGGSEIAASDTTVNIIQNIGMNSLEKDYQEDVITKTYSWDINLSSPTPFVGIPAGTETCWNMAAMLGLDLHPSDFDWEDSGKTQADDAVSKYEEGDVELSEPGKTGGSMFGLGPFTGGLTTANETSEPIDRYHFTPIVLDILGNILGGHDWKDYDDDTNGKPGGYICIGGKALHSFDDIITAYGEPMGVYGAKESNTTYVWKATGDADIYVLARYDAQEKNPDINIAYIKDCEVSKSLIENGDFVYIPDNLYDLLSELGLYTE